MPIWFDGVCILIALLWLYPSAINEFKSVSFTLLCFFVVSEVVYQRFFLDVRNENNWIIYLVYNVINLAILFRLHYLKSHLVIIVVITANLLLNIVVSYYFKHTLVSIDVYNAYPYVAGLLMISCLAYMWGLTNNGIGLLRRYANYRGIVGILFRSSPRLAQQGLL